MWVGWDRGVCVDLRKGTSLYWLVLLNVEPGKNLVIGMRDLELRITV